MTQTLFNYSPAERSSWRIEGRLSHRQRLAAKLGDGRDWEYTGLCVVLPRPTGTCSCGHSGLRYLFHLSNPKTGATAIVGSSCIECYQEANPDMVEAIGKALAEKLAEATERRKQAKELAQNVEVSGALARYTELAYRLDEILATGAESFTYRCWIDGTQQTDWKAIRRVTREVYRHWHTPEVAARRLADRQEQYPTRWKQYKLKAAFLRVIRERIAIVEKLLAGPIWEQPSRF